MTPNCKGYIAHIISARIWVRNDNVIIEIQIFSTALVQATNKKQRRYGGRKTKPYLLNGKFRVQTGQRMFKAVGTTVWYSGADKKTEIIKIPGKTTEEIEVQVIKQDS